MIAAPQLRVLIDGLARRFENRSQQDSKYPEIEAFGWGQFLDGQPKNNQVGPYGTCSGIITRALAGRGHDMLDGQVSRLLTEWWTTRNENSEHAKFLGQTIRLAMFHLAIRLKGDEGLGGLRGEVADALLRSVRPDAMWGNYVMTDKLADASPRLIATSLVVLSFTLFRPDTEAVPAILVDAVRKLEDRILGSSTLPKLHLALAAAAILSIPGHHPNKDARRRIASLAYATQILLPELGVYFYDFQFDDSFKTDYFIVPTELVLGIAGYQPSAPAYLRYRSESTLLALVSNLQGFDGFYRPDNEQRISSVNQGWVAMFLGLAERAIDGHPLTTLRWAIPSRLWYELLRKRADHFWLDIAMCILSGVEIVGLGLLPETGLSVQSFLLKAGMAILAFLVGRLYAPVFLKRIFIERT